MTENIASPGSRHGVEPAPNAHKQDGWKKIRILTACFVSTYSSTSKITLGLSRRSNPKRLTKYFIFHLIFLYCLLFVAK